MKMRIRIQFQNVSCSEWIYIFPCICFHIKGWREEITTFRRLFPKDRQGFQILIFWLWFQVFIESDNQNKFT